MKTFSDKMMGTEPKETDTDKEIVNGLKAIENALWWLIVVGLFWFMSWLLWLSHVW
jgi:hypothetical protein